MNNPDAKTVFAEALRLSVPAERYAYLDEACGGNQALRQDVESLLSAYERAGDFFDRKHRGEASDFLVEPVGTMIGRYKLLEKIGEGGFGIVYRAEQVQPVQRQVALKIIKPGMDTRLVVARFEAERQALAMMDHPNIASIFDGGATETGRPYFVMELVKGVHITQYCDQHHLSVRARLELFVEVCKAVQHAHQKGVIHRDIKPSNVLVAVQDDRPVPKVIDFGVAKATLAPLTEKAALTRCHQWIGTPAYMSPEQTAPGSVDIDTRSDIYSLGVLLYELLAGCTPLDTQKLLSAGYDAALRTIREQEPAKPSTRLSQYTAEELGKVAADRRADPVRLSRFVRGDLDWIVMKALEKNRQRRYETANALADDVARFLRNDPVSAVPPTLSYQLIKLVRRRKHILATGAFALFCLLGVTALSVALPYQARLKRALQQSEANRTKAEEMSRQMEQLLAKAEEDQRRWGEHYTRLYNWKAARPASLSQPTNSVTLLGLFRQGQKDFALLSIRRGTNQPATVVLQPQQRYEDVEWTRLESGDTTVRVWLRLNGKETTLQLGLPPAEFDREQRKFRPAAEKFDSRGGELWIWLENIPRDFAVRVWLSLGQPATLVGIEDDAPASGFDPSSLVSLQMHQGVPFAEGLQMLEDALRQAGIRVLRAGKHTFVGPGHIVRESALKASTLAGARKTPFPDKVLGPGMLDFRGGVQVRSVISVLADLLERKAVESAAYPANKISFYSAEAITMKDAVEIIETALRFQGVEPVLVGENFLMARAIPR